MKRRGRKPSGKKEKDVEESSESGDIALENDTNEEQKDNRKAPKRKTAERKQDTDDESDHPVEKKKAKKGTKKQKSKKAAKGSASEDDEESEKSSPRKRTLKDAAAEEENGGGDEADDDSEEDFESSPPEKKKTKKGKKKPKNKKAVKGSASEDDEESEKSSSRKSNTQKGGAAEEENGGGDESGDESEEDFEVESILDHKFINGTKHYLIRWKGYEAESDTWEPASTVNCADLISKYNAKLKKEKKTKKSTSEPTWDENEDFEVSRILEVHFNRDGSREFLVNWKGYPSSENTWEPEENMDCKDLIAKFMEKVEKAKDCGVKELRTHRPTTDRLTLMMHAGAGRRASKRNKGTQRIHYHDQE